MGFGDLVWRPLIRIVGKITRIYRLAVIPLRDQHMGVLLDDVWEPPSLTHRRGFSDGSRGRACSERGSRRVLLPREWPCDDVLQPCHLLRCVPGTACQCVHHPVLGLGVDVRRDGHSLRGEFSPGTCAREGDRVRRRARRQGRAEACVRVCSKENLDNSSRLFDCL